MKRMSGPATISQHRFHKPAKLELILTRKNPTVTIDWSALQTQTKKTVDQLDSEANGVGMILDEYSYSATPDQMKVLFFPRIIDGRAMERVQRVHSGITEALTKAIGIMGSEVEISTREIAG